MLMELYGSDNFPQLYVFEWFKSFKDWRETTEDDFHAGQPTISKSNDNTQMTSMRICETTVSAEDLDKITGINKKSPSDFVWIIQHVQCLRKNIVKTNHLRSKEIKKKDLNFPSKVALKMIENCYTERLIVMDCGFYLWLWNQCQTFWKSMFWMHHKYNC